jgi:D-threo-aldose 1-dehydrogenase
MNPLSKRTLGKSGVEVTVLGFGGGMLGEHFRRLTEADAQRTVEAAYQIGLTLFDTSPHYGHGVSEQRIGLVLRQHPRESYVLSTKVGRYLAPPTAERPLDRSPYVGGLDFNEVFDYTRDGTLRAIDQSMARLGISTIDCLIIHDVDVWTHGTEQAYQAKFKEAMDGSYRVLHELREQHVIRAIGVGVNEVRVCMAFATAGDFDFFDLAGRYTLLEQGGLDDFLPLCEKRNIGIMLGGPYNSGILATGAVAGATYNYVPAPPDIMDRVRRIETVCRRHSVPLAAAALQFPLGHPSVTSMIPGTTSAANVERNFRCMSHPIPAGLWAELKHENLLDERAPVPEAAA